MHHEIDSSVSIVILASEAMEESYGSTSLRRHYTRGEDGRLRVTSRKTSRFVSLSHFFTVLQAWIVLLI